MCSWIRQYLGGDAGLLSFFVNDIEMETAGTIFFVVASLQSSCIPLLLARLVRGGEVIGGTHAII